MTLHQLVELVCLELHIFYIYLWQAQKAIHEVTTSLFPGVVGATHRRMCGCTGRGVALPRKREGQDPLGTPEDRRIGGAQPSEGQGPAQANEIIARVSG